MNDLIILNKPYGVICQFSEHEKHQCLKDFVEKPGFYPAGRLDTDSEGLLLLTNNGSLQAQIADPKFKQVKTYWAQVEGSPDEAKLDLLRRGVDLGDLSPVRPRLGYWKRAKRIFYGRACRRFACVSLCLIFGWKSKFWKGKPPSAKDDGESRLSMFALGPCGNRPSESV